MAVVLASVGASFYFWRQSVELRRRFESAHGRAVPTPESVRRVREGDRLPEFVARDTEGREVRVVPRGGKRSLLFIYDPKCDRCEAGIPAWSKVSDKLKQLGADVEVVALSVADSDTTVQHARSAGLPFAAVPFPSIELQKKYGVTEVPLTVVVDPQGVVLGVWDKPLDEGEVGDVVEFVCPECIKRAVVARSTSMKEERKE